MKMNERKVITILTIYILTLIIFIVIAETVYISLTLVAKFLKMEENIKNIFYMLPIITIII